MFALEQSLVNGEASEGSCFSLGDHDCEFELRYKGASLFDKDREGDEQFVFQTLLDADSGSNGVFEGVESEAERGISVEDVVEELSALLDLEVVGPVEGSLEDGASQLALLGLALSAAHEDIKGEDVVNSELLLIDLLLKGLLVDDDLVAVNQVLLELVGKYALERSNLVGIADLLDDLGDFIVEVAGLEQAQSSLSSLVSGENDVGLLASHSGVLI
jgi:hypothetical protein